MKLLKYLKAFAASTTVLLLSASNAWGSYACAGYVTGVTIGPTGVVAAERIPGGIWVYVCQIGATYNGVGPEQCKAIYTLLLTAQTTGKQVTMWFEDGLNCTTHPAWAPLTGWYFGPMLVN